MGMDDRSRQRIAVNLKPDTVQRMNSHFDCRFHLKLTKCFGVLLSSTWVALAAMAADAPENLSERDFLAEIPLVYSASRLPQQPQDTAGAMTVIDREMIRASGARDLSELFRLVPGFQVGISSGGRAVVSYHGLSGQVSQRMQVYLDGRSLYAPYLFGGVDWSSLSVPLDEVERIEILRGSNSVSYGANAFLGVIHIITREAAQSIGWSAQVTQGNEGIADRYIRWGSSSANAQWRVVAGTKSDDGLLDRVDAFNTDYIDIRAEIQTAVDSELSLSAGHNQSRFGIGYDNLSSDPLRFDNTKSSYFNARYKRQAGIGEERNLSFSQTNDRGNDNFVIDLLNGDTIPVENDRTAFRRSFGYQHFKELNATVRSSWGLEYNSDHLVARRLFSTNRAQTNQALRAYINAEWKPSAFWTLNLGGLVEKNGDIETQFSSRASLNWKPSSDNSFKLGYSSAFRAPSLFEQHANWRIEYNGDAVEIKYLSRGGLQPEQISAWDLVYVGQIPTLALSIDARLFQEKVTDLITGEFYLLPDDKTNAFNAVAYDLRNNAQVTNNGVEYQIGWRPFPFTLIAWSQYVAHPVSSNQAVQSSIPEYGSSLLVSHAWPGGLTTGLTYTDSASFLWLGEARKTGRQRLATLRMAKSFRFNDARMQVAAVWRAPLAEFDEFRALQSNPKQFWVNLSIEY